MTISHGLREHVVSWHNYLLLILALLSLGGCLESFTRATKQPSTAQQYEWDRSDYKDDLPTPHLFNFNYGAADDD